MSGITKSLVCLRSSPCSGSALSLRNTHDLFWLARWGQEFSLFGYLQGQPLYSLARGQAFSVKANQLISIFEKRIIHFSPVHWVTPGYPFGKPSLLEGWAKLYRLPWWETLVTLSQVVEASAAQDQGSGNSYHRKPRFVLRVGWSQADLEAMLKLHDHRQGQNPSGSPFLHLKNEMDWGMVGLIHFCCPFSNLTYLKCLKHTSNIEVQ